MGMSDKEMTIGNEGVRGPSRAGVAPTRYAFISRHGSVAYVAIAYDETGGNLPNEIDGNGVKWTRIEASHGEVFSLLSTADMDRDLHVTGVYINEMRTKPRATVDRCIC